MSTILESSSTLSLDAVQQAFDHWRDSRTQRGHTPVHLRKQAISLMPHYKRAHICKALRVNDQALRQWAGESSGADYDSATTGERRDSSPHDRFVELPPHTAHTTRLIGSEAMTALRIELPNGSVIRTNSEFTLEQVLRALTVSPERCA